VLLQYVHVYGSLGTAVSLRLVSLNKLNISHVDLTYHVDDDRPST
jgi:hypothetical protein